MQQGSRAGSRKVTLRSHLKRLSSALIYEVRNMHEKKFSAGPMA